MSLDRWRCRCGWVGLGDHVTRGPDGSIQCGGPACARGLKLVTRALTGVKSTCPKTASHQVYRRWCVLHENREMSNGNFVFSDGSTSGSYAAVVCAEREGPRYFVAHGASSPIRNVGAELQAVALGLAKAPDGQVVTVVSDYLGTAPWLVGENKVSGWHVLSRLRLILTVIERRELKVRFIHHRGHQSDPSAFSRFNGMADSLCWTRPR